MTRRAAWLLGLAALPGGAAAQVAPGTAVWCVPAAVAEALAAAPRCRLSVPDGAEARAARMAEAAIAAARRLQGEAGERGMRERLARRSDAAPSCADVAGFLGLVTGPAGDALAADVERHAARADRLDGTCF